jgi:uncharacterized protein
MKKIAAFFLLLLLSAGCSAVLETSSLKVFAITDGGKALSSELILSLRPGTGRVWTDVEPLVGTSTQSTAKLAVENAKKYSQLSENFDYFFDISSNASLVDGPSAGAAMGLLVVSMLQDREIPLNVALTGTITAEGGVGPVGGVFEKAKEAARVGIRLFMIPPGESRQTVKEGGDVKSINLIDYAQKNWGLKIIEVNNIDDVLRYAFSEISSIDVNAAANIAVDFVPEGINLSPSLVPMKGLTEGYIARAEDSVRSAKTALSGTLLDDPVLVDAMLTYLNESEKTLETAKILYEQNYLYSAANYSFLAMVNSSFVRDVSENPQLLQRNSTAFNDKASALGRDVDSLAFDLNKLVPIDGFEWDIAAKERLSWAKLKLGALDTGNELVIVVEQDGIDTARLSEILDYEYALAWHSVASDFFGLTKGSQRAVLPDSGLGTLADSYIANAENGLVALGDGGYEDIQRRLDSAKQLRKEGWVYASIFDASSALALANAEIFSKNKDLAALQNALLERLVALDEKISLDGNGLVWARLYLDHAKYFLDSSAFYDQQGQSALALESAQNGIGMVFLAEAMFDAASASYNYLETLPSESFVDTRSGWQEKPDFGNIIFVLLLLCLLVAAALAFGLLASGKKFHVLKAFSFDDRLDEILRAQKKLSRRHEKGFLPDAQFESLNRPLQEKLNRLLAERRVLSADYVELDLNKSKIAVFEKAIRDLKQQFKRKKITAEDFAENVAFYSKRVALLKHIAEQSEKKLKAEEARAKKEFSGQKAHVKGN